jgi:phospholipid/cholesterol/gamma-HCH transport system permease protein
VIAGAMTFVADETRSDSERPQLAPTQSGARLMLAASGAWTARHAEVLEPLINSIASGNRLSSVRSVAIDMAEIQALDTYGAWLLERLMRLYAEKGLTVETVGIASHYRGLIDEVHDVNRRTASPEVRENRILVALEGLGRAGAEIGDDLLSLIDMLGALFRAFFRVIVKPRRLRLTSLVHHLDRTCWQAVPIILAFTFLIGAIIYQQSTFYFRKFGAEDYAINFASILVLRELGVLLVSIMVAGRSGSSYTAELGAMKMREEIDALQTMGRDPIEVLILPRVIALVIAVPILTLLGDLTALYGGALVAYFYGGISPEVYLTRLRDAVSITQFKVGIYKAPFMALVIGAIAAGEGMKVKGSAESLGLKTTASVVKSIFLVIVIDGFFAIFFTSIGW